VTKRAIIGVICVVVAILAAGFFVNRYWIKPVTGHRSFASTHPKAPAFTLTDIFGHPLSLDQYRGKVVLLDFWATWCGPCQMEIPGLVRLENRYRGQGLQVLGVVMRDQAQNVPGFYKQFGMDYPVAMGSEKLADLYGGIFGLPTTFLIGRDGRIYSKVIGGVGEDYFEPGIRTLLAASPGQEARDFQPMEGSETPDLETSGQVNSPVPGIDVSKLTKAQLAEYEELLNSHQCACGCNMSVFECLKVDPDCSTSREQAKEMLKELKAGKHEI
jgi:cytochrome c biogenesis protein CcmG, thiol:disulfide interchange protein DsbE